MLQQQSAAAKDLIGDGGEEEDEEEEVDSLEAIVESMRDLAKNRGDASRLNKGDRAASRGAFRDLLAIIEVGSMAVHNHSSCRGKRRTPVTGWQGARLLLWCRASMCPSRKSSCGMATWFWFRACRTTFA